MAVAAPRELRDVALNGDGEEGALQGVVPDRAAEVVAPQTNAPARAVDRHPGGAQGERALGHLDGGHRADGEVLAPEALGEIGELQIERPVVVRRARGKLAAHRLQRGHVPCGEHGAWVLREASAVRVVEGRERLALPEQDLPRRFGDRRPDGGRRGHPSRKLLVCRGGDEMVWLRGVEHAVMGGVGPHRHCLGPQRLQGPALSRLRAHHSGHVVLERDFVHDGDAVPVAKKIDRAPILSPAQAKATAGQPEPGRTPPGDLETGPAGRDAHRVAPDGGQGPRHVGARRLAATAGATSQFGDLEARPAHLNRRRSFGDGDPDRGPRRGGLRRRAGGRGQRPEEQDEQPHRPCASTSRTSSPHRRPSR